MYLGAVFGQRFNSTIRDLLEEPDFEKSECNWLEVFPTITKQSNNRKYSPINLTPRQVFFKKIEDLFIKFSRQKKKLKARLKIHFTTSSEEQIRKTFSKRDTANWSYNICTFTEKTTLIKLQIQNRVKK